MGALPGSPAGLPVRRERRPPGAVRRGLGRAPSRRRRAGTCRRCSTPSSAASSGPPTSSARTRSSRRPTRHRAISASSEPRLHGRPGPLPDRDRRARRRRPPGRRRVGRVGGHGHELGAAGPAGPQGARPAGRGARRPVDHLRARPADGPRLGRGLGRADLGRAALAVAGPPRHDLRPARGARRHPVAVLGRDPSRRAVPPLAAVGGPGARARGSRSCRSTTTRPWIGSTTTSRSA